jgi:hypothetical protein
MIRTTVTHRQPGIISNWRDGLTLAIACLVGWSIVIGVGVLIGYGIAAAWRAL